MVRHNNVVPNAHFKKKWQFHVRTWFEQPARKLRRRQGRPLTISPLHMLVVVLHKQVNKVSDHHHSAKGCLGGCLCPNPLHTDWLSDNNHICRLISSLLTCVSSPC